MAQRFTVRPAALFLVFGGGLLLGWSGLLPNPITRQPAGLGQTSRPLWEAWQIAEREYVDQSATDPQKMMRGAIEGMLASLGDVGHTGYLAPDEVKRMNEALAGELSGIGARMSFRQQRATVVGVLPDSPAQKAGLRAGDVLLEVNGEDVRGLSLDQVVKRVVGPAETKVTLSVAREGEAKPLELVITRARISVPDVTWQMVPGRPVAHVAIQSFGENAHEQLKEALAEARQAGARGLVVDLRANGGGLKEQAVAVTSEFLEDGTVFIEQDASGRKTEVPVRSGGTATDLPVVVLIDEGTASSAEIFAGALQDHGRAKLVGVRTFGTGTVLQPYKLSDDSAILLAVAQWLTPKGRKIWHQGIEPHITVTLPEGVSIVIPGESALEKTEDRQLLRALEVLQEQMR